MGDDARTEGTRGDDGLSVRGCAEDVGDNGVSFDSPDPSTHRIRWLTGRRLDDTISIHSVTLDIKHRIPHSGYRRSEVPAEMGVRTTSVPWVGDACLTGGPAAESTPPTPNGTGTQAATVH